MKTTEDLLKLIPAIVDLVETNDHEIGETSFEQSEDGWGLGISYMENHVRYEKDGWMIDVYYKCTGEWEEDGGDFWTPSSCELKNATGEVTEIEASHFDDETKEDSEFTEDDFTELRKAINDVLKNII